jgi:hypothetical protein
VAVEYPDIVCEYVEAKERYECDGIQIVPSLEPAQLPIGGYSVLIILLQSALSVPTEVALKPDLPTSGRFKAEPVIEIGESSLRVQLAPAQVGTFYVPVRATPVAREGHYELRLNVAVKTDGSASRVRPSKRAGGFRSDLLDDVVGLDVGRVLGVPYTVIPTRKISVPFAVMGRTEIPEKPPAASSQFESLWKIQDAEFQERARLAVNSQRAEILRCLAMEPLYAALMAEGHERCTKSGSPLRVGEAIALAKILAFSAYQFLHNTDLQDGLLVPIWELALRYDLPMDDPMWVLRNVGFGHLVRLSVAFAFGLIGKALNGQPWDVEERRTLAQEIPDRLERGLTLPVELIYIPLLAASTLITHQVNFVDEDLWQSLRLLRAAKHARATVFSDPDLAQSSQIFDRLLDAAQRRAARQ